MESSDLERRANVWDALSELFVGGHLQDFSYTWIVRVLYQSEYSVDELETILFEEVSPVFRANLSPYVIFEIDGWSREFIVEMIQAYLARRRLGLRGTWIRIGVSRKLPYLANDRWQRVKLMLEDKR